MVGSPKTDHPGITEKLIWESKIVRYKAEFCQSSASIAVRNSRHLVSFATDVRLGIWSTGIRFGSRRPVDGSLIQSSLKIIVEAFVTALSMGASNRKDSTLQDDRRPLRCMISDGLMTAQGQTLPFRAHRLLHCHAPVIHFCIGQR